MGETVRLYALPHRYYWESSTRLGTLYTWEHQRWGWAEVERAVLERAAEVIILAAPPHLVAWADAQLHALKADAAKAG